MKNIKPKKRTKYDYNVDVFNLPSVVGFVASFLNPA